MADAVVRYDWKGRNAIGVPLRMKNRCVGLLASEKHLDFKDKHNAMLFAYRNASPANEG